MSTKWIKSREIDWCAIEPGEAIIGGDDHVLDTFYPSSGEKIDIEYTYWISKYPVTFAQFQPFVEQGYTIDDYWTPAGLEWRGEREKPLYWLDDYWHISNHPIVGITWYEAVAFSNWLNQNNLKFPYNVNQNNMIRLPTESEWEKAARGTHGQFFSYGNFPVPEAANHYSKLPEPTFSENPIVYSSSGLLDELLEDRKRIRYLGRTSAVGIFTQDRSPYGLMDICGNVWEWTISKWRQKYMYPDLDQLEGDQKRVLKGGAWESNSTATRCASRGRNSPDVVKPIIGFRVVLAPNL